MKIFSTILFFLISISINIYGQANIFQKIYGLKDSNCAGNTIVPLKDGNFIIGGMTKYTPGTIPLESKYLTVYFIKINQNGDTIWTKNTSWWTSKYTINDMYELSDGSLICVLHQAENSNIKCNNVFAFNIEDLALIKLSSNGDILWEKTIQMGCDQKIYNSLMPESDKLLISYFESRPGYSDGIYKLSMLDTSGQFIYTRWFSPSRSAVQVEEDLNGGYIGMMGQAGGPAVYRFKQNGDTIWTKQIIDNQFGAPIKTIRLIDETYISGNGALYKIDSAGTVLWNKYYTVTYSSDMAALPDGGFLLLSSGSGLIVTKYNSNGDSLWSRKYSDSPGTYISSKIKLFKGGYCVVGTQYFYQDTFPYQIFVATDTLNILTSIQENENKNYPITIYPNPSSGEIHIKYKLDKATQTVIEIYSFFGQKIKTITEGIQSPGQYEYSFHENNPGIFLVRILFDEDEFVEKAINFPEQ